MPNSLSIRLKILVESKQTVFRTKDLRELWRDRDRSTVIVARRMIEKGLIVKLGRGLYAIGPQYDRNELANRLVEPSYVSFNAALFIGGVNFQVSKTIESVAAITRERTFDGRQYRYRAMKRSLRMYAEGIVRKGRVLVASPERALLDSYYFGLTANIDDWERINMTYLKRMARRYPETVRRKVGNL